MKKGVLIGILILIVALVVVGVIFIYPKVSSPKTPSSQNEILEVRLQEEYSNNAITDPSIEISLWYANGTFVGTSMSNEEGIAIFEVPIGNYLIGFNELTFPDEFIYPEFPYQDKTKTPVEIKSDTVVQKRIPLFRK
jgi:hypothetical protein